MSSPDPKNRPQNDDDKGDTKQKSSIPSNQKQARGSSGYQSSGMTPSIVTTINNTDPNNSTANHPSIVSNNNLPGKNRRTSEQYESYIEDSFVGHWEHEDDDVDEYQEEFDPESPARCDDDHTNLQHPSTIEFDFDSFGPESFIYTPPSADNVESIKTTTAPIVPVSGHDIPSGAIVSPNSATQISIPPALIEVSSQSENQEERDHVEAGTNDIQLEGTKSISGTQVQHENVDQRELIDSQIRQSQHRNLKPQYDLIDPTQIDMKVIEPYKKVISHAGYCHNFDPSAPPPDPNEPAPAVIVFSACYLPDRSRRDYNYVMDHLFLYVLTSLHELIADDYILIYLHKTQPGGQSGSAKATKLSTSCNVASSSSSSTSSHSAEDTQNQNNLPTFSWMKRCYQMIDRRLRKNLRILYLVKPTFWLKTIVIMCKPFISAKFSKKLRFVEDMGELKKCIPVDKLILPASADHI